MSWRARAAAAAVVSTMSMLSVATPADAQRLAGTDEARDNQQPGLDITSFEVRNRDRAIVVIIGFRKVRSGKVIASLTARGGPGVRIVNRHRPDGEDRARVLWGSFDAEGGAQENPCGKARATSSWSERARSVTLRLPARCLNRGVYGAVHSALLTEGRNGDVDSAPGGRVLSTEWIPRG